MRNRFLVEGPDEIAQLPLHYRQRIVLLFGATRRWPNFEADLVASLSTAAAKGTLLLAENTKQAERPAILALLKKVSQVADGRSARRNTGNR